MVSRCLRSAPVVVDVGLRTEWEPPTFLAALWLSTRGSWRLPDGFLPLQRRANSSALPLTTCDCEREGAEVRQRCIVSSPEERLRSPGRRCPVRRESIPTDPEVPEWCKLDALPVFSRLIVAGTSPFICVSAVQNTAPSPSCPEHARPLKKWITAQLALSRAVSAHVKVTPERLSDHSGDRCLCGRTLSLSLSLRQLGCILSSLGTR